MGVIMIFDTIEQPGGVFDVMSLRLASYRGPSLEPRRLPNHASSYAHMCGAIACRVKPNKKNSMVQF